MWKVSCHFSCCFSCVPPTQTFLGVRQAFLPSQTSAETKRYFPFFGCLLLFKETNHWLILTRKANHMLWRKGVHLGGNFRHNQNIHHIKYISCSHRLLVLITRLLRAISLCLILGKDRVRLFWFSVIDIKLRPNQNRNWQAIFSSRVWLPYERSGDGRREFWIKPLKETNLAVAQPIFGP